MIVCDFCLIPLKDTSERKAITSGKSEDDSVHICFDCVVKCMGIVDEVRMTPPTTDKED